MNRCSKDDAMTPRSFVLDIPDPAIADLKTRLGLTRFPDAAPGEPWAFGASVDYMPGLVAYLNAGFDWRALGRAPNTVPPFPGALHELHRRLPHCPPHAPPPPP